MGNNVKDVIKDKFIFDGKEFDFEYKKSLSAKETAMFINFATDIVVGDNFYPTLFALAFKYSVIACFTNVDLKIIFDEESDDSVLDNIESFVENGNAADIVINALDQSLAYELKESLRMNIEYKTGVKIGGVEKAFEGLIKALEKAIGDFDFSDINNTIRALSDIKDNLSPDKILNAYSKTDIFKENRNLRLLKE